MRVEIDDDQRALFVREEGDPGGGHGEVETDVVDATFVSIWKSGGYSAREVYLVPFAEMEYGST